MGSGLNRSVRKAVLASVALGSVAALAIAPGAADAFSSGFDSRPVSLAARGGIGSFTPASVDPRLAARITVKSLQRASLFRFTPATDGSRRDRSVTVAVRVDPDTAKVVTARAQLAAVAAAAAGTSGQAPVQIAPMAFNLGVARGYDSFAHKLTQKLTTPAEVRQVEMPDLATFAAGRGEPNREGSSGRFVPRIELGEDVKPGRAPRTLEGQGVYSLDVGGSYRVSGNVAVTAGVRYRSESDRIAPLTDATQDSQAVYVGTKFRF